MNIGKRIRQRRDELHWSQEELAARMGVRQNVISRLESGGVKNPGAEMVRRLGRTLGVTADWLIDMYEEKHEDEPEPVAL